MIESCRNCKHKKKLWWWLYKDDGHLDRKKYGHCCTLFINEGEIMKLDTLRGQCECWELEEKGGASVEK